MPLACNINRRGRLARLIYGIILILAGLALAVLWAFPAGTFFAWALSLALFLAGAFGIFEAANAWCVMRAMGFKTPV